MTLEMWYAVNIKAPALLFAAASANRFDVKAIALPDWQQLLS